MPEAIHVGGSYEGGSQHPNFAYYTRLLTGFNLANGNGVISSVSMYVYNMVSTTFSWGLFYPVSGTIYKCRSAFSTYVSGAGGLRTWPCNMAVQTGDILGVYDAGAGGLTVIAQGSHVVGYRRSGMVNACVPGLQTDFSVSGSTPWWSVWGDGYTTTTPDFISIGGKILIRGASLSNVAGKVIIEKQGWDDVVGRISACKTSSTDLKGNIMSIGMNVPSVRSRFQHGIDGRSAGDTIRGRDDEQVVS